VKCREGQREEDKCRNSKDAKIEITKDKSRGYWGKKEFRRDPRYNGLLWS